MSKQKVCLTAILALSPVASFAQATATFSGEAVALRANALGISLALSDTGALQSSGGNLSRSLASVNVLGLVAAGQSVVVSNPNLAISLPGGISLIVNEQTSSSGANAGSMTVNALHVKGPSIDIVVASATVRYHLLVTILGAGHGLNTAPQTCQLHFFRLNQGVTS